jgi:toxin ParE1/3/4
MAYLIRITSRAQRDLAHLFDEIFAEHTEAALNWYRSLKIAILSLEEHPNRCPVVRKRDKLRHLLYGSRPNVYRVIFHVLTKQKLVEVIHIRHGARRKPKQSDLI